MQLGQVREYVPGDVTHLDTRGSSAMAAGPANDRPIEPETLRTHVQLALESGHRDLIATRCALIAIAYAGLSVFNAFSMPEPIVIGRHIARIWQFEDYIASHSDVEFTHAFCDVCMTELYPEHVHT